MSIIHSPMLPIQAQNRIVQKMVKMANGQMALVHFLVSFEGNKFNVKVLSVQYKESQVSTAKQAPALCGKCAKSEQIASDIPTCNESIISPYLELQFFVNQPTRAPSLI